MGCYSCGGNPNTFCRDCTYPKDTWIAPVDSLPDPFMGDFDHLFRTPDGNMYALAPDRSSWILMGGAGGTVNKPQNLELDNGTRELTITRGNTVTLPNDTQSLAINGRTITISNGNAINLPEDRDTVYNDAELRRRIQAVEDKADNFVSGVTVSREGNKVKLTYTFVNGAPKEVEFEDKDTVTLAYDDTALKARVKALEDKPDKDTVYDDRDLKERVANLEAGTRLGRELSERVSNLESKPDNDKQNLSLDANTRVLSISNGNNVILPNDKQTIRKEGNKLILSNDGGEVELPQPNNVQPYDDSSVVNRLNALEAKEDKDTKYNAKGKGLFLDDKNQFYLGLRSTYSLDLPTYQTDEDGVEISESTRYNSRHTNLKAYSIDNDNTKHSGFLTVVNLNFDFELHERQIGSDVSNGLTREEQYITTFNSYAFMDEDSFSYHLTDTAKLEGVIYYDWNDPNGKVVFAMRAKIVWLVKTESGVETFTHELTKEELDSKEPAQIIVKDNGSTVGELSLTLKNMRFKITSPYDTVELKNTAQGNLYFEIDRK